MRKLLYQHEYICKRVDFLYGLNDSVKKLRIQADSDTEPTIIFVSESFAIFGSSPLGGTLFPAQYLLHFSHCNTGA